MTDRHCPCGAGLDRSSAVRSLKSPYFRMFMSIRTLKSLTSTTKVCNLCRLSYNKWKKQNPEYTGLFDYMESGESEVEESDTNSVRTKIQRIDDHRR